MERRGTGNGGSLCGGSAFGRDGGISGAGCKTPSGTSLEDLRDQAASGAGDDFDEVWANQVGRGFGSVEELEAYTKHQYTFYEFGFWALVEKETGDLIGVAGLKVPEEDGKEEQELVKLELFNGRENAGDGEVVLELGYHIFPAYRRRGYGLESCAGILEYGRRELEADRFLVRIRKENVPSLALAEKLGFREK